MNYWFKPLLFVLIALVVGLNVFAAGKMQQDDEKSVLVVTNGEWLDADTAILDSLESMGLVVEEAVHDALLPELAEGMSLVYVSSTVSSGNVANTFKEVEVPVIMIEPYALDDMGMTTDDDQHRFFQAFQRDIYIEEPDHYLAAGFTEDVEWLDYLEIQSAQGVPSDEGIIIATYLEEAGDDTNMIYPAIFAYEKGAMMADSTLAPERRYFAGWNDEGLVYFTEDGWKLWKTAINWCLYVDQAGAAVEENANITESFELSQNYPNPFNPTTHINYTITAKSQVRLSVYNIQGEEVACVVDQNQHAGSYTVAFDGSNLSSGLYFYSLKVGDQIITKKMTMMK